MRGTRGWRNAASDNDDDATMPTLTLSTTRITTDVDDDEGGRHDDGG
jgi:hypothetical protein